jgi:hypothetical protein
MPSIIAYRKVIDEVTTHSLRLPLGEDGQLLGTELATVDGVTYVSLPDGAVLPEQVEEIAGSVETVAPDAALRETIRTASPHAKFISQQMIDKIRSRYTIDDEMYFARIGVGAASGMYTFQEGEQEAMMEFSLFVEEVRQWGRDQRSALGL